MSEQPKGRPQWIRDTGLVSVTLPEPPLAQKYRGGQTVNAEDDYARALSDAALESLVSAGVTLLVARFYSGFGLEFEKIEIDRTRELITHAHTHGLKVAATVQLGLVVPETLTIEEHECHNWLEVNADGRHCAAGGDAGVAGMRPCYNSEGFLRYMERVCALAVDCGADLVHFDNVACNHEPDTCRCPLCVAAFREFLRQQYGPQDDKTRQAGMARFGHTTFTHVRPPVVAVDGADAMVCSPHEQEWVKFKARTLSICLGRLSRAIARRNPECAVGADVLRGNTRNESLEGISYAAQLPLLDVARLAGTEHDVSVEAVAGSLKLAGAFGVAADMGATCGDAEAVLALNLALNRFGLGNVGTDSTARAYRDFLAAHKTMLLGAQPLRGLAVYSDIHSRMFDPFGFALRCAVERQLLGASLPFEPLFSSHIAEFPSYRCVVLANCECLSDDAAQALTRYVEGGGGVVAVGAAGARDEWGRVRAAGALASLLGEDLAQPSRWKVGAGRAANVPVLQEDGQALADAVAFCAGDALPWHVEAESGSVLSQAAQAADGSLLLHVVDLSGAGIARGLRCALASDRKPQQVQVLAPGREYGPLTFLTWDAKGVQFAIGDEITSDKPRYLLLRVTF